MSTDAGTEEHRVSGTLLPMPRRIAQLPSLPVPDAPTCSCCDAALAAHVCASWELVEPLGARADRTLSSASRADTDQMGSKRRWRSASMDRRCGRGPHGCVCSGMEQGDAARPGTGAILHPKNTTRHAWRDQRLPKDPAQRLSDPKSAGTYQPAIEPRFGHSVHTPCPAGE